MENQTKNKIKKKTILKAFRLMCQAKAMSTLYEDNFKLVSKYAGMQLLPQDFVFPYYRDDAMILSLGMRPLDLMLQLLAKKDDPFSGGRTYYAHPSIRDEDKPKVPHQSSATGMQAIPATGVALGMAYKSKFKIGKKHKHFQMAALHQLPIIYLIQDNEWDISASADEVRAQDAFEYARGFNGLEAVTINGSDFAESYATLEEVIKIVRKEQRPFLVHAKVPLLNHHTSGVRMEWYRDDLEEDKLMDPYPIMLQQLKEAKVAKKEVNAIIKEVEKEVQQQFKEALTYDEPEPQSIFDHQFAPSPILEEVGERSPEGGEEVVMVDSALHAVEEMMRADKGCLLYGQDVGHRLGGVFREAATLAQKFGKDRVFNTPIQEAFIVGSTVGMSAVGLKPIVEVQFADYIWPGLNQLFTEVSRSNYLSNGKWPVGMILRVPIGAYGSGGPYHSGSTESVITNIKGIKIAYPSNGADMKGLMKAAYHDPNPVVMLEHKGLYWSKVKGTDRARVVEPAEDYILPFGKGRICLESNNNNEAVTIITYGMGVHWAMNAAEQFEGKVEVVDLRTLVPLDEQLIFASVRKNGKCIVLTEEPVGNSFARGIAGLIQENCFEDLDAPIKVIGSLDVPAIPLNSILEQEMLPNAKKVGVSIEEILKY